MCKKIYRFALLWVSSLVIPFVSFPGIIHAETSLKLDTLLSGGVEISTDGETWTAFSQDSMLRVGDSIRTGTKSAVSLKAEDGSMLYLEELTHLKIAELTFSRIDGARIFRFHLEQGALTAKAGRVDANANIFELRTHSIAVRLRDLPDSDIEPSVTIIAQSSSGAESNAALVIPAKNTNTRDLVIAKTLPPIGSTGSTGAREDPFSSKVHPLSGEFDLKQLNNEKTRIEVAVGSGVDLTMDQEGQEANVRVDKKKKIVTVSTGDQTIRGSVVASEKNNAIQLQNESSQENDTKLELKAGDLHCGISSDSSIQLTISQDAGEQGFPIILPPGTTSAFAFSEESQTEDGSLQGNKVAITSMSSGIQVNGKDLLPGEILVSEIGDTDEDSEGIDAGTEDGNQETGEPREEGDEQRHEPPLIDTGAGGIAGGGNPAPTPGSIPTEVPGSPILP